MLVYVESRLVAFFHKRCIPNTMELVNLSNLLKFIDLRTHEGAQWEIQKVAEACLDIATDLYPELWEHIGKLGNDYCVAM